MDHHVGYHTIWNHSDCAVICFGPLLLHFYNIFTLYWSITFSPRLILVFYKPHSHPNGFYWGHQCSLTPTPANSINVFNMQSSDDCNRKEPGLKPDCLQFERGVIWVSFAKCKQRRFFANRHQNVGMVIVSIDRSFWCLQMKNM